MAYRQFRVSWTALDYPVPEGPVTQGTVADMSGGYTPSCEVDLQPYPPPGVGAFSATCVDCGATMMVMTTGLGTAPRTLILPCAATRDGSAYLPDC